MKQEIKLTNDNENTIHVDDVDVSKGVYAVNENDIQFMQMHKVLSAQRIIVSNVNAHEANPLSYPTLLSVIKTFNSHIFYQLPDNRRIVTEKPLTVEDLKDTDHVGFITHNGKGYIAGYDKHFMGIQVKETTDYKHSPNYTLGNGLHKNLSDVLINHTAIKSCIKSAYRFTTRKKLYQWLAED